MSLKFRVFATFLLFSGFLNAYQNDSMRDRIQKAANSETPELLELIRLKQANSKLVGYVGNEVVAVFQAARVEKRPVSPAGILKVQAQLKEKSEESLKICEGLRARQEARGASSYERTIMKDLSQRLAKIHLECALFINSLEEKQGLVALNKGRLEIEEKRRSFDDVLASLEELKADDL
ncbi:MAG: hypothetical protein P1V97_20610, partial [Planctomycetota bacterium]|nr:hypothetical protein [Planctomycetota bacterium]